MPAIVLILWLPTAIALMAVTWVLTLGALSGTQAVAEERVPVTVRGRADEV
jgi:hypothetical protein